MNLKVDLEKNKETIIKRTTILKFNLITTILIFVVLIGITMFLSIPLGITFSIISVLYLIFLFIVKDKLKNIKNKLDEEVSE